MVSFILHTHLPYVLHHGTWPHGSDWLCEAVAECYLPLLDMCDRLLEEGIRPAITFDISPVLTEQLAHADFPEAFERYCTEHVALAEADRAAFQAEGQDAMAALAERWAQWYADRLEAFTGRYAKDLVGAFRRLQDDGAIEVMTCGLTHGYFPLLAEDESVVRQVALAQENYQRHFGRRPRGIWLPECAYRPSYPWRTYLPDPAYAVARQRKGVEQILADHGLEYFVTDQGALQQSHGIGLQTPQGRIPMTQVYGVLRRQFEERSPFDLFRVGGSGHPETAVVLTRHRDIALQVWSGETGYPGDPDYLDFHKKYHRSALRYWRVTDNTADMQYKQPYEPAWAESRVAEHARHFVRILEVSVQHRRGEASREPILCLPFDTELFGHWWFEGPYFLEHVLRGIAASSALQCGTASQAVDVQAVDCVIELPESSWGRNGHHEVWMNEDVQWTWEREYRLEYRLRMLRDKHRDGPWDATMRRIILNAYRELLLAQASDWQFLISTFSSREYAEKRFYHHAADTEYLCDLAERYAETKRLTADDEGFLEACETRNGIFTPELEHYLSANA